MAMARWSKRRRTHDAASRPFRGHGSFERDYERQLRKVSNEIKKMLEGAKTESDLQDAGRRLREYGNLLKPWADIQAERMVMQVCGSNERRWGKYASELGIDIKRYVMKGDLEPAIRKMREEAARYIKDIPKEASLRIGMIAQEAMVGGMRPEAIEERIRKEGEISENRARLIARTEVARSNSILVQARAESLGSKAYIWQTAEDSRVRESHMEMNGKVVHWNDPPTLDGMKGHAGQLPNCRCIQLPLLSDAELQEAFENNPDNREQTTRGRRMGYFEPEPSTAGAREPGVSAEYDPNLALITRGNVVIPDRKLTEYVLNPDSPRGGHKAIVFESALGYNKSNADKLKQAILDAIDDAEKEFSRATKYGKEFKASMNIKGVNGKTVNVKTTWIIRPNEKPQLITAMVKDKKGRGK
jgi:SPP1 gp7 family putative phage head morphogenesis protein